jgi:CHC2 zinc finger
VTLSAESIAFSLDKGRRIKTDHYTACCPAHDDRNPSLSITQTSDTVLFHCHSGCSQSDLIEALISRGLWANKSKVRDMAMPAFTKDELEYYNLYCLIYRDSINNGYKPSKEENSQFRSFSRVCYLQGENSGL